MDPTTSSSTARRWWIYQRERFPVFRYGVMSWVFVSAILQYSSEVGCFKYSLVPCFPLSRAWAAIPCAFLTFFQLRIADEFKDQHDDAAYRPYRPVPRGLLGLRELGAAGIAAALIQFALVVWVDTALLPFLALVWLWMALMTQEFFVPAWLRARPIAYMASHLVLMPLIALFVSAFQWRVVRQPMPAELLWVIGLSYFLGVVLEIGRKIRGPEDEEKGVATYTAIWGRPRAVAAWLASMAAAIACVLLGASAVDLLHAAAAGCFLVAASAVAVAAWFLKTPAGRRGCFVERTSEIAAVVLLLSVGPMNLFTMLAAWR